MRVKPITFTKAMIPPIIQEAKSAGTGKHQTRRIANLPGNPDVYLGMNSAGDHVFPSDGAWGGQWRAPYAVGDILWVKEPWRTETDFYNDLRPSELSGEDLTRFLYEADADWKLNHTVGRYRHARFMPRWVSRLTLEVTDVRIQRVQEISEEDAIAEGMPSTVANSPRIWFMTTWERVNGEGAWNRNDWVAAYTFRAIMANVDLYLGAMEREPVHG